MEDISSLIWLGIAILWFLTRLVRRGVKKAARGEPAKTRRRPPRPTAPPATEQSEAARNRFSGPAGRTGREGSGPPPIVPR